LPFCHVHLSAEKPSDSRLAAEPQTWGQHLRRQRILRGLRQRDLAVAQGVSVSAIHNWETGRAEPAVRCLPGIIAFLGYCPYAPGRPLGERLRVAREARGLSRKQLAELVGIDEGTLWKWERGLRVPRGPFVVVREAILGLVQFDVAKARPRTGLVLAPSRVREIERLRVEGFSLREIGRRLGVAASTVRSRVRGRGGDIVGPFSVSN
jgi:transcriptional regulator with XRE-family HTH domain